MQREQGRLHYPFCFILAIETGFKHGAVQVFVFLNGY